MRHWFPCAAAMMVWGTAAAANADPTAPGDLTNALMGSNTCDYCHTFGNDEAHEDDPPFAPYVTWQGSMMGNTARDPVFWAGVAVADADHPDEVIDCIRCHVPTSFLDDRAGAINSVDDLEPADRDGVTCELCHRMTNEGALGNAQYAVDDDLVGETVARRGPWDYTDGVPPPFDHATMGDPFTGSSELCGTCHDVTTGRDRVDDDGVSLGVPFNEQRTYSEWAGSVFAVPGDDFRSCADCHMPEVPDSSACRNYVDVQMHPEGNRRHDLVGANRFMLEILRDNFGDEILPMFFERSIQRLDEFVQTAATVEVTAPDTVDLTEGIEGIEVTVTNESGHKLPSGYSEGRVMWIEVAAAYDGQAVWSSGLWDGTAFEQDDQLRRYEGIAEEYSSGTTLHLLLNDHWVVDSRIPPRGLAANIETDPVGGRYTLQPDNTWPHWDTHSYAFGPREDIFDVTDEDVLDLRVRLLYVINTAEYIEFLAGESDAGQEVATMFDTAGGAPPVELAVVNLQIPITGFGEGPGSSTGSSTSGGTSDTASASETMTTAGPSSSTATPTDPTDPSGSGETTEAADGGGGSEGCGCSTTPGVATGWWMLLFGAGLARRRRYSAGAKR